MGDRSWLFPLVSSVGGRVGVGCGREGFVQGCGCWMGLECAGGYFKRGGITVSEDAMRKTLRRLKVFSLLMIMLH